jgi:hypothetical protein
MLTDAVKAYHLGPGLGKQGRGFKRRKDEGEWIKAKG